MSQANRMKSSILDHFATAEFDESQHPRDDHGKFAPVGAGENGGLSSKVTEHAIHKGYEGGFGYKYHEARTMEGDKTLQKHMDQRKWSPKKQAAFVVSRMGRHAGDALTSLQKDPQRAMQGLKQTMDQHDKDYVHTNF